MSNELEHEPKVRDRPDELPSTTQRIKTGYGKIYVRVGYDDNGDPFEVFVDVGNSGTHTNAWSEAIAKLASTALRAGVDPEEVCESLLGIRMDRVEWDNGDIVYSIPDAVGIALMRVVEGCPGESVMDRGEIDG